MAHAADATGQAIETTLSTLIQNHPRIKIFDHRTAVDLISQQGRYSGAYALDNRTHQVDAFTARFIILATGGASKVYLYTSNPDCSSGDGIAIGWRPKNTILVPYTLRAKQHHVSKS